MIWWQRFCKVISAELQCILNMYFTQCTVCMLKLEGIDNIDDWQFNDSFWQKKFKLGFSTRISVNLQFTDSLSLIQNTNFIVVD